MAGQVTIREALAYLSPLNQGQVVEECQMYNRCMAICLSSGDVYRATLAPGQEAIKEEALKGRVAELSEDAEGGFTVTCPAPSFWQRWFSSGEWSSWWGDADGKVTAQRKVEIVLGGFSRVGNDQGTWGLVVLSSLAKDQEVLYQILARGCRRAAAQAPSKPRGGAGVRRCASYLERAVAAELAQIEDEIAAEHGRG